MKREYKFRAWDGSKMHYNVVPWQWDFVISTMSHKCVESTGTGILGSGGDTAVMEVPAIRFKVLMQFTGQRDKTGKEVYEDDIIVYDLAEGLGEPAKRGLVRVVKITGLGAFGPWDTNISIIGNIHQNPDLIIGNT